MRLRSPHRFTPWPAEGQSKPDSPVYPTVPAKMRQYKPACWLPFRDAYTGSNGNPQTVYDVVAGVERTLAGTNPKPVPWLQTRGNPAFGAEAVAHHMYFPAPDLVPWVAPWTLLVTGWRGSPDYASHSTVYTTTLGQTYVLRTSLSFNRIFGAYIQNSEYATARNWVIGESYNLAYRFESNQRFCIIVNGEIWLDTIATRAWTPSDVNLIGWSTNNASSNMRGTSLEELTLLYDKMTDEEMIRWSLDPYGYWDEKRPDVSFPWFPGQAGGGPAPQTGTVDDTANTSELFIGVPIRVGVINENAQADDVFSAVAHYKGLQFDDTANANDSFSTLASTQATFEDSADADDTMDAVGNYFKTLSDDAEATDDFSADFGPRVGIMTDQANANDSFSVKATYRQIIEETAVASDLFQEPIEPGGDDEDGLVDNVVTNAVRDVT